ncbi:MAG TPA: RDD family protein [Tepidisphaeraceae bacterium]|nr:RDD family protein [Tepidisphaeraceae bacterium]
MERTPFLPRLAAFLIDLGIFAAAVHLFTLVDVLLNVWTNVNNFGVVSLLGGSVLLIGYGALEVLMAGTPGKRACGLIIGGARTADPPVGRTWSCAGPRSTRRSSSAPRRSPCGRS